MTLAEKLKAEGRQEGIEQGIEQGMEKGIEKGKAESILNIATKRFGTIPAPIAQALKAAPSAVLAQLLDRVLEAETLEEWLESSGLAVEC